MLDAGEAHLKYLQSIESDTASLVEQIGKQREHNAQIGLSTNAIGELVAAREEQRATLIELQAIKALDRNGDEITYNLLMREAQAVRELAAAKKTGSIQEAVAKADADTQAEWKKTTDQIYQGLSDSLYRGFEAGKGFMKSFLDGVKNTFKATTLQLAVKYVMGGAGSLLGLSGAANADQAGGQSGGPSISGLWNMGKSAYNAMTGSNSWLTDFSGSATNAVSRVGGSIGGDFGQSIISNAPEIGAGLETVGQGLGYLNAAVAASKGQWGRAVGSAVGTYFGGPIGGAIGNTVGGWVDKLSGNTGSKPSIEGGYASDGTLGSANGRAYVDGMYGGAIDASAKKLVDDVGASYNSIVKSIGGTAGKLTAQSFIGLDQNGGTNALHLDAQLGDKWLYNRWTENGASLNAGKTDAEMQAAVALSSNQVIVQALKETNLGPVLNQYLQGVTIQGKSLQEITAVLTDVTVVGSFQKAIEGVPIALANASVETVKAVAEAVGGMPALQSLTAGYFQNFYTDAERTTITTQQLTSTLGDLGLTLPGTRDEFKRLVDAQDLTTDAGRKTYAALMGVQDAFAQITPAAQAAAAATRTAADIASEATSLQQQYWQAMGDTTSLRAAELAKLDPSNQALQQRIWLIQDETKAATEAKAALDRAITSEKTRIQAGIDAAQQNVAAFSGLFDLLKSQVVDLYGQVDSTAAMSAGAGQAFISQALATAQSTGYLPDQTALSDAIGAVRAGFDKSQFASRFEADKARLELAGELAQLKDKTGDQLTTAELQLRTAKDQLTSLDALVSGAQKQIDALNGIDSSVLSIDAALSNWLSSKGAKGSGAIGANASPDGSQAVFGGGATFGGTTISTAIDQSPYVYNPSDFGGVSADEYQRLLKGLFPGFAVGTNYVPHDMIAQIHEGEAIIPKAFNPYGAGGSGSQTAPGGQAATQALADELRQLREEQRAQSLAFIDYHRRMQRILDNWDVRGMPATRVPA